MAAMSRYLYSFLLAALLPVSSLHAEVRRVEHPDGRVEYTNIAPKQ